MTPIPEGYRIRPATLADARVIAHHRTAMYHDMKALADDHLEEYQTNSAAWLSEVIRDGTYQGWLMESGGAVIAGGGLLLSAIGPIPGILAPDRNAHIVNVYTEPEHRRRGLARALLQHMLQWCAEQKIPDVTLTASEEGYALYQSLGFVRSMHMRLQPGK